MIYQFSVFFFSTETMRIMKIHFGHCVGKIRPLVLNYPMTFVPGSAHWSSIHRPKISLFLQRTAIPTLLWDNLNNPKSIFHSNWVCRSQVPADVQCVFVRGLGHGRFCSSRGGLWFPRLQGPRPGTGDPDCVAHILLLVSLLNCNAYLSISKRNVLWII